MILLTKTAGKISGVPYKGRFGHAFVVLRGRDNQLYYVDFNGHQLDGELILLEKMVAEWKKTNVYSLEWFASKWYSWVEL